MSSPQKRKRGDEDLDCGSQADRDFILLSNDPDLVIRCQDKVFKSHKAIVRKVSAPFAAMVDGPFLEAANGEINFEEEDPDTVLRLISWMYTGDFSDTNVPEIHYPPPARKPTIKLVGTPLTPLARTSGRLLNNTRVYILADRWLITELKDLACRKYEAVFSGRHSRTNFVRSIRLIYDETMYNDRQLKDVAIKVAHTKRKSLPKREDFKALLSENGQIGLDLFQYQATVKGPLIYLICGPESEAKPCLACGNDSFFAKDTLVPSTSLDLVGLSRQPLTILPPWGMNFRKRVECSNKECEAVYKVWDLVVDMDHLVVGRDGFRLYKPCKE